MAHMNGYTHHEHWLSVPTLFLERELSGPNIFVIGRMDGGNVWGRVTKQRGVVVVVGSGESRSVRSTASVVA